MTDGPAGDASDDQFLNAYYFRAHMYTMVPEQIREDLEWMADRGTDAVSIGVLEQDLFAAVENIEFICSIADDLGLEVYAVPSRWGGLVAGSPKVPSLFAAQNPHTWARDENGEHYTSNVNGVHCSYHHPEVREFFVETLDEMLDTFDFDGIIWDEPKALYKDDHSEAAVEKLGADPDLRDRLAAKAAFYESLNAHVKDRHPEVTTALFLQSNKSDDLVEAFASIDHLDEFGCDGRPWPAASGGVAEGEGKNLLDEDAGERFLDAAHAAGKRSLWLVENHNMVAEDVALLEAHADELLAQPVDHLIYYYYPRNLENPDENMAAVGDLVDQFGQ